MIPYEKIKINNLNLNLYFMSKNNYKSKMMLIRKKFNLFIYNSKPLKLENFRICFLIMK